MGKSTCGVTYKPLAVQNASFDDEYNRIAVEVLPAHFLKARIFELSRQRSETHLRAYNLDTLGCRSDGLVPGWNPAWGTDCRHWLFPPLKKRCKTGKSSSPTTSCSGTGVSLSSNRR